MPKAESAAMSAQQARPAWLEGTMSVINSTVRAQSPSLREQRLINPANGSPSSTASPMSQQQQRLPSNDALNRSLHNSSSFDGQKSKDQIIAELRKANVALLSQTADMEADFMNQCNTLSTELATHKQLLETKTQQIQSLESRVQSSETRIRERDLETKKLKEEAAFSRHTVTDLKNQLYQLQHEVEEAEYDKVDEVDKWHGKATEAQRKIAELEKERLALKSQLDAASIENQDLRLSISEFKSQLDEAATDGSPEKGRESPRTAKDASSSLSKARSISRSTRSSESPTRQQNKNNSSTNELFQNWKQLEEAQESLSRTTKALHETQSSLVNLEHKHKQALKAHTDEISALNRTHKQEADTLKQNLDALKKNQKSEMETLKRNQKTEIETQILGIKSNADREVGELKCMLRARDDTIASLQDKLERCHEEILGYEAEYEARVAYNANEAEANQRREQEKEGIVAKVKEGVENEMKEVKMEWEQKLEKNRVKIAKLEKELAMKKEELIEEREGRDEDVKKFNEKDQQFEKVVKGAKKEMEAKVEIVKRLEKELEEKNVIIKNSENIKKELVTMLKEKEGKIENLCKTLDELRVSTNKSHGTNGTMKNDESATVLKNQELDKESKVVDLEAQLEELRSSFDERIAGAKSVNTSLTILQAKMEKQLTDKDEETTKLKNEIDDLSTKISCLDAEHSHEIKRIEQERDLLKKELKEVRQESTRITEEARRNAQRSRSPSKDEQARSFNHLREELAKVSRDRIRMEKDFAKRLAESEHSKFMAVKDLKSKLDIQEDQLEEYRAHKEEIEQLPILNAKLKELQRSSAKEKDEMRQDYEAMKRTLQEGKRELTTSFAAEEEKWKRTVANYKNREEKLEAEINSLTEKLSLLEKEHSKCNEYKQHLREAQIALVALDDEKGAHLKEIERLKEAVFHAKHQSFGMDTNARDLETGWVKEKESLSLNHMTMVAEKDSTIERLQKEISMCDEKAKNLQWEIETLYDRLDAEKERYECEKEPSKMARMSNELEMLRATLRRSKAPLDTHTRNTPRALVSDNHDFLKTDMVERSEYLNMERNLNKEISGLENEMKNVEDDFRSKLENRDATISALVKSSITQEQKLLTMKEEVARLQRMQGDTEEAERQNSLSLEAREAEHHTENENLKAAIAEYKRGQQKLSRDIFLLKKKLSALEAENDRLKNVSNNGSSAEDLQQKICLLEKEREKLTAEHRQILQDRDAALSTLVKSSLAQEHQVTSLQKEIEELKKQKGGKVTRGLPASTSHPSWEEFNRLQQESEIFAGQIIEQDEELEDVRSEMTQLRESKAKLENEISALKIKMRKIDNEALLADVKEELEDLQRSNSSLREELRESKRQLRQSQNDIHRIADLETELEQARGITERMQKEAAKRSKDSMLEKEMSRELQEVNKCKDALKSQLLEQEEIAEKLRDSESRLREDSSKLREDNLKVQQEIARLERELSNAQEKLACALEERKSIEDKLTNHIEFLQDTKKQKVENLESELCERDQIISRLKKQSKEQNSRVEVLEDEIRRLSDLHNDRSVAQADARSIENTVRAEIEDEMSSIKSQKEFLGKEVARLQDEIDLLKKEESRANTMNHPSDEAEEGRAQFEKTMISTYERKLSLMQMNKDVTIDGLRKELAQAKERQQESEAELSSRIRSLETQYTELEAELEAKMRHKNAKIQFLEQAVSAHEQVSGHMKAELDQLQSGMESVSVTRRAEVEELQEELMDVQTKATKHERDITALKMKLEERKLRHKDDVAKLKETIAQLESDTPMMRDIQSQRDDKRADELYQKVEQLKWRIASLQEENQKLRERLDVAGQEGRASKNDKWRNSALQEQVFALQARIKELESSGGDGTSIKTSSTKRTSKSSRTADSPRRAPRAPTSTGSGANVNVRRISSSQQGDISTHTEMTF